MSNMNNELNFRLIIVFCHRVEVKITLSKKKLNIIWIVSVQFYYFQFSLHLKSLTPCVEKPAIRARLPSPTRTHQRQFRIESGSRFHIFTCPKVMYCVGVGAATPRASTSTSARSSAVPARILFGDRCVAAGRDVKNASIAVVLLVPSTADQISVTDRRPKTRMMVIYAILWCVTIIYRSSCSAVFGLIEWDGAAEASLIGGGWHRRFVFLFVSGRRRGWWPGGPRTTGDRWGFGRRGGTERMAVENR